jgi:hypothetical protein
VRRLVETVATAHGEHRVFETVCNRCGHSCMEPVGPRGGGEVEASGLLGARTMGGYSGAFPPDMEWWTFDLCEPCLAWLVSTFVHYPCDHSHGCFSCGRAPCDKVPEPVMRALLVEGKTAGVPPWMLERYALAMARGAERLPAGSVDAKMAAALTAASAELARQHEQRLDDFHDLHTALDAVHCPGDGAPAERVLELRGTTSARRVAMIRRMVAALETVVRSHNGPPGPREIANEMACAEGRSYLDAVAELDGAGDPPGEAGR